MTVLEDERGTPLDVGRKQRTVSTPLKRALYSRDRGCSFPGCERKRYLDAHHLKHWAEGGDTSLENLTLLCTHHHRCLHEGGFRIAREADGELRLPTCRRANDSALLAIESRTSPTTDVHWHADDQSPPRRCASARRAAIVYRLERACAR